jgi:cell division protein FtsL
MLSPIFNIRIVIMIIGISIGFIICIIISCISIFSLFNTHKVNEEINLLNKQLEDKNIALTNKKNQLKLTIESLEDYIKLKEDRLETLQSTITSP